MQRRRQRSWQFQRRGASTAISRTFCRSLSRDGRTGLVVGHDDLADPGRIIDRIEVLFAEIRGYGDDGVAGPELRSQLLHSAQDRAGASPNKQVMIASERKAGVDGSFFTYGHDLVRLGEVGELWPHARADAGNVSFPGCAAKCDGAGRLDGYNLDPREFLMERSETPPSVPVVPDPTKTQSTLSNSRAISFAVCSA